MASILGHLALTYANKITYKLCIYQFYISIIIFLVVPTKNGDIIFDRDRFPLHQHGSSK